MPSVLSPRKRIFVRYHWTRLRRRVDRPDADTLYDARACPMRVLAVADLEYQLLHPCSCRRTRSSLIAPCRLRLRPQCPHMTSPYPPTPTPPPIPLGSPLSTFTLVTLMTQMAEWTTKDRDFQLVQERRRCLKEKRAKAIDLDGPYD